jgi:F0F1-type ATP synthase assembly protein I
MPTPSGKSLITGGKYLALATALPGYVVAGFLLGAFADHWLHWPILRGIGIILGTLTGLGQIVRQLLRDERRAQTAEDHPND